MNEIVKCGRCGKEIKITYTFDNCEVCKTCVNDLLFGGVSMEYEKETENDK